MQLVPSHNERQSTHADFILVGHAAPLPGLFPERLEKRDARRTHQPELLSQVRQGALREVTSAHLVVLLEAGKRRLVAARNPQCAVTDNAVAIAALTQN